METETLSSSALRGASDTWLQTTGHAHLLTDRDVVGTKLQSVPVRLRRGTLIITMAVRSEPKWFYPVLTSLQELSQLPDNWDTYGGQPIQDSVIVDAMQVLLALELPVSAPHPNVVPGSPGDIQFEWHVAAGDVEILVSPDGSVFAFVFTRSTGERIEFRELAPDVVRRINSIFQAQAL